MVLIYNGYSNSGTLLCDALANGASDSRTILASVVGGGRSEATAHQHPSHNAAENSERQPGNIGGDTWGLRNVQPFRLDGAAFLYIPIVVENNARQHLFSA